VAVRLYFLGGTRQLTELNAGIEPFLLRASALESGNAVERTGSRPIFETTPDWTVTGFVGLREDLDSSWSGLVRQVMGSELSDASVERARRELMARAWRRDTQPDLRIFGGLRSSAFRGHPYAIDPEGTPASLDSLSRSELESYRDEQFVTSRLLLAVVGDVSQPRLDSLVASTLGRLPAGDYRWTLPPPIPTRSSTWRWEDQTLPTNYIVACFGGPIPTDSDYFRFRALLALLSGQLDQRIRDREALSYAAYATVLDYARPAGLIYVSTSEPAEAMDIVRETIADNARDEYPFGYRPPGWNRWLEGFKLDRLLERMTSDGEAASLARAHLYFGDVEMATKSSERMRKVDFGTMREITRRYVKDIQFAFMGDTALMRGNW
jgi:zinc protease